MLFLDGSIMITFLCHKHPRRRWRLTKSTPQPLVLPTQSFFFFLFFSSISLQLIPPLCPLCSNPPFLSFISAVENGISTNVHTALPLFQFPFTPCFLSLWVLSLVLTFTLFNLPQHVLFFSFWFTVLSVSRRTFGAFVKVSDEIVTFPFVAFFLPFSHGHVAWN